MKLRNKKTWEIGWLYCDHISVPKKMTVFAEDKDLSANHWDYNSLAELNEEWEDYHEEPKDFWYIDDFMIMCGTEGEFTNIEMASFAKKDIEKLKAIGNYFETKEEAEKAVDKLKAWKRLEYKGFRFYDYRFLCNDGEPHYIEIKASIDDISDPASKYARDLRLLFGDADERY